MYLHTTADHDYAWGHEYEPEGVEPYLQKTLDSVRDTLKEKFLPQIGVFADFEVAFVEGVNETHLGAYVDGTHSLPFVALNRAAMEDACAEYGAFMYDCILSTTVHELAHAVQDEFGWSGSEIEAERLAKHWFEHQEIDPKFKARLERALGKPVIAEKSPKVAI